MAEDHITNGIDSFITEVGVMARVHHPNILRLEGYVVGATPILIYDYVSMGDASTYLAKAARGEVSFTWKQRVAVALGCAEALTTIHANNFVHRDFKATNVLLRQDLTPVVADFGLARAVDDWKTHVQTRVMGSVGYIDPIYFDSGMLSRKSDTYAFGIFLLELVSGCSALDARFKDLRKLVTAKDFPDPTLVVDAQLQGQWQLKQVLVMFTLIKFAIFFDWEHRPGMDVLRDKLKILINDIPAFPSPTVPSLVAMARGPRSALRAGLAAVLAGLVALTVLGGASAGEFFDIFDTAVTFIGPTAELRDMLIANDHVPGVIPHGPACKYLFQDQVPPGTKVNAEIAWRAYWPADGVCSSISFHSEMFCAGPPSATYLRPATDGPTTTAISGVEMPASVRCEEGKCASLPQQPRSFFLLSLSFSQYSFPSLFLHFIFLFTLFLLSSSSSPLPPLLFLLSSSFSPCSFAVFLLILLPLTFSSRPLDSRATSLPSCLSLLLLTLFPLILPSHPLSLHS
ncbi:unnamed protein product [Closterium sp. Yama58-4]|nr:unnamed protein product [Closterium sp. Yama58-4]